MEAKKEADMLLIHIEQSKPIEVGDFTKSLNGLCGLFTQYAAEKGMCATAPKLYVNKIQEGCIDVFLQLAETFVPFIAEANIYFDFVSYISKIKDYLVKGEGEKPNLSKVELDNLSDSMAFAVRDPKGEVGIKAINGDTKYEFNDCNFFFTDANSVQNQSNAFKKELLTMQPQTETIYQKQLLTICQAKGDIKAKTGNKGSIDCLFGGKPLPLSFCSEELKLQMLKNEGTNPFTKAFLVDVEIRTAGGKPVYYITALHDVLDMD